MRFIYILFLWFFNTLSAGASSISNQVMDQHRGGALTYKKYCIICHGKRGFGDGVLPLAIRHYPSTDLVNFRIAPTADKIKEVVLFGLLSNHVKSEMPPYVNELTDRELESIVNFVILLRKDNQTAVAHIDKTPTLKKTSVTFGKIIFRQRCVKCHGYEGKGDGALGSIIKDPPPYNLTISKASDTYLRALIRKGGAAMNRSPHMPPWGAELTRLDIDSLILYLLSIREKVPGA